MAIENMWIKVTWIMSSMTFMAMEARLSTTIPNVILVTCEIGDDPLDVH